MAKQREIGLDSIPGPGEPLKQKIHDDNKRILEEELAERAERARVKLSRWQLLNINRRYKKLHQALNKAKYNKLIMQRWELWQAYQRLKHALNEAKQRKKRAELLTQLKQVAAQGKKLNAALAKLQPLADEFKELAERLRSHKEYLSWEKKDKEDREQFRREAAVWEQQIKAVFRQSARLHHASTTKKGKQVIRIPIIERTIFKEDRVLYHIKTTTQTLFERFAGTWHSALPYNVDINELTCDETLANLSAGCRRPVAVERSNSGTQIFFAISRLDSADGIPNSIPYGRVIDWYPVPDHAKTPWAAGVTKDRKVTWYNFEDTPHVLIAGSTKSGKSNHVNQMIATLVTMNSPAELRLLLLDLKGGIEFTHWEGLKHQLRPMVKSADKVLDALKYVRSIMERRLASFEKIKAKNLASYNEKVTEKLPRILMVIDEMATLQGLGELTTDIHNELRVLAAQGRAVGVNLLICTQHVSVDVIPGWVKTNMGLRISGKMPNHQASMVILDSVSAATLPNIPGRLVFSLGRYEVVAQSPFISDNEIARAVSQSKAFPDPDNREFTSAQPVAPKEKFTPFDALEMALTKFGGKLSPKRIHDEVGNEVISLRKLQFMIEDMTDGGVGMEIEHRGIKYKLDKERRYWILKPMTQVSNENVDEDTAEIRVIDGDIEEVTA